VVKRYLWWWVGFLVVFVVVARVTGSGEKAWSIAEYVALSIMGLIALLALLSGFLEMRERRRSTRRDD
jgi:uncharacterized membrane protein YuzA (DUF378 family)